MAFSYSPEKKKADTGKYSLKSLAYQSTALLSQDQSLEPSYTPQNSPSIAAPNYHRTAISDLPSAYKWPEAITVSSRERILHDLAGAASRSCSTEYNSYFQTIDLSTSTLHDNVSYTLTARSQEHIEKISQGNDMLVDKGAVPEDDTGFIDLDGSLDLCLYSQTALGGEEDEIKQWLEMFSRYQQGLSRNLPCLEEDDKAWWIRWLDGNESDARKNVNKA